MSKRPVRRREERSAHMNTFLWRIFPVALIAARGLLKSRQALAIPVEVAHLPVSGVSVAEEPRPAARCLCPDGPVVPLWLCRSHGAGRLYQRRVPVHLRPGHPAGGLGVLPVLTGSIPLSRPFPRSPALSRGPGFFLAYSLWAGIEI